MSELMKKLGIKESQIKTSNLKSTKGKDKTFEDATLSGVGKGAIVSEISSKTIIVKVKCKCGIGIYFF